MKGRYKTMKQFKLPCYDNRKDFYGKAVVIETNNGIYLKSYDTFVAMITPGNKIIRLWSGYSATTMRHVNSFLEHYNLTGGGKAWWDKLEIHSSDTLTNSQALQAMYHRRKVG